MKDITDITSKISSNGMSKMVDDHNQETIRSFLSDVYIRFCGSAAPTVTESYGIVWGGNVSYRKGYATARVAYEG